MYIDHAEMNPSIFTAMEREERFRSRPNTINGIIQHEVALQGFNLTLAMWSGFHRIVKHGSFEIPSFVFYMDTAEQIVSYPVSFLNLAEEYQASFPK